MIPYDKESEKKNCEIIIFCLNKYILFDIV